MIEVIKTGKEISISIEEADMLLELLNNESVRLNKKAVADLIDQKKEVSFKNLLGNFYIQKKNKVDDLWLKIFELQKALKDTNY